MVKKVLPAILEKFPLSYLDKWNQRGIRIQQDGAKPHIAPNDSEWMAAVKETGKHIEIYNQPANSLDTNINDLAFLHSIQSLYYDVSPADEWHLIAAVQCAFDAYPVEQLNKMWLTHQTCMNQILKDDGGNYYDIPHLKKDALMKKKQLPSKIKVCKEAKKFD